MNVRDMTLSLTEALLRSHLPLEAGPDTSSRSSEKHRAKEKPPFTVTISREAGALGATVAAEVGKRLGWPTYDQEIINKVAEEMGKSSTHVRRVDERHFNWLEECLTGLPAHSSVSPSAYLKCLVGTIRGLGIKGGCVIVGRGANFILPPETTLRFRLISELKDRIKVIAARRGVSEGEAAHWIERTDEERARFVQANFGKDSADPRHYDLVLNTSRLSAEECAETIIHTLHLLERREPLPRKEVLLASERAG